MKVYLVGGAVRDKLLGLPIKERDYVVVGASVSDMLSQGYQQVGKEFPVFLHPQTKEEYALARTERKVKPGYKGFEFNSTQSVSLEEDLIRRDLTINAMALTPDGVLIDPYHGKDDLENKLLRHVSPAFAEDPVRILRVARFMARFCQYGFQVASETLNLMAQMVNRGEVDALVAERVWKELERALTEKNPEKFFTTLIECGAGRVLFPQLATDDAGLKALVATVALTENPKVRASALFHNHSHSALKHVFTTYKIPNDYKELINLTATHSPLALQAESLSAPQLVDLFGKLDIFRRYDRFKGFVLASSAIASSQHRNFNANYLLEAAKIARNIDVNTLLDQGLRHQELATALVETRIKNLNEWLRRES